MTENTYKSKRSLSNFKRLCVFVESRMAQNLITGLILINALTLGLETAPEILGAHAKKLNFLDRIILGIFTIEILIKLAHHKLSFFKNGWNTFDFLIVGIALILSTGSLTVLRTLRIFRAMKLLSVVPSMRKVTQALFSAIPGMLSVGSMILLIFYVSAVLSTNLFGEDFTAWFGSIGRSMFTLFQIMTLESWSMGIVRPVMETFEWAWVFFVPFILITSFAVLNLFIGIIVDAMQTESLEENEVLHEKQVAVTDNSMEVQAEILALRKEVKYITEILKTRSSPSPS